MRSIVLVKGALVVVSGTTGMQSFLWFQYNPSQLTRSIKPSLSGGESGSRSESVRLGGTPVETFSVEVQFDASTTVLGPVAGIAPFLASLELLVYPTTTDIAAEVLKLQAGTIEVAPTPAPLVLFSWGTRLVPVVLQSYSITEEGFDDLLNPIRAKVKLEMRVLGASDISPEHAGYKFYILYQKQKEVMSKLAIASWLNLAPV